MFDMMEFMFLSNNSNLKLTILFGNFDYLAFEEKKNPINSSIQINNFKISIKTFE
jgi:hypothetical protein